VKGSGEPSLFGARHAFLGPLGFPPDPFQNSAFEAIDAGRSVLVSAPTGSGKTLVADYAVAAALAEGRKAFYTTPLKALSNQKLGDFAARYGAERVGLLTGDVSHQPDAPIVVMTTEVLRNMLFARSSTLEGLGLVVLDEVHYLQDPYRGSVWEEVIILAPPEVTFVYLSATVSNAEEFGAWLRTVRGPTDVVIETRRPVELRNHVAVSEKGTRRVHLVPVLHRGRLNRQGADLDERVRRQAHRPGGMRHGRLASPRRTELIEELNAHGMLPAIVFIFSRAACDDAVGQCVGDGLRLTTGEQREEIRRRCEERTEGLPEQELAVLGYGPWLAGLEAGIGAHHAGMIPAFREAVEECFSAGLLQVVFATETLSLGINMPARTVVIERLTKVRADGRSVLTSGEYAQLTGRAGRRGLDAVGHAVVVWSSAVRVADVARLATSPAPDLRSSFRATYNLAVNLVRRYPVEQLQYVLDRSFAQFLDHRSHQALSRRLQRTLELLDRWGYVDRTGWRLTERGALLARVYHESDLLVAEALSRGLLDGLDPPGIAALLSLCTFESRNRWQPEINPPVSLLPRIDALVELATCLRDEEEADHLARTRLPDAGFAEAAWRWAKGESLERVLLRSELAPGDFVRNTKQLIDLLRQLADVAPVPATAATAGQAAHALFRGVVAASSIRAVPEDTDADPSFGNDDAILGVGQESSFRGLPGDDAPADPAASKFLEEPDAAG
jgi:ATP-dependent RNA helicase HelY